MHTAMNLQGMFCPAKELNPVCAQHRLSARGYALSTSALLLMRDGTDWSPLLCCGGPGYECSILGTCVQVYYRYEHCRSVSDPNQNIRSTEIMLTGHR